MDHVSVHTEGSGRPLALRFSTCFILKSFHPSRLEKQKGKKKKKKRILEG